MPERDACACGAQKTAKSKTCWSCCVAARHDRREAALAARGGRSYNVDLCACGNEKATVSTQCYRCSRQGGGWLREPRPRLNNGYVYLWNPRHPLATKHGYVAEHRAVLFDAGVETPSGHHVHHVNGDKTDNRLENLEVIRAGDHSRRHAAERGFVRNQYGTWPVKFNKEGSP